MGASSAHAERWDAPRSRRSTRRARRAAKLVRSRHLYLMCLGFASVLLCWYLLCDVLQFWRFAIIPGPTEVFGEWFSPHPAYGISIFTHDYYLDIWVSVRRVIIAFAAALALGIPFGLVLGWWRVFREYTFPVFELLRPIPILAWVPLAILMFASSPEGPIIVLTFLAAFFITALNTMLGVASLDRDLIRAAYCLGSRSRDVFRHVVIPGSLPFVFTGLQIAMGAAWFSLVAGEIVAGKYGLGYLINAAYTTTRYPTILIAMFTLGILGYASSALLRFVGSRLMAYRQRALAQG